MNAPNLDWLPIAAEYIPPRRTENPEAGVGCPISTRALCGEMWAIFVQTTNQPLLFLPVIPPGNLLYDTPLPLCAYGKHPQNLREEKSDFTISYSKSTASFF
jgi:hypothetical protein